MIVATHQPIFLPWPGFFYKAAHSDRLVLLDEVQFPTGRSWLTRNRLKNAEGVSWLRVPVKRKGRGLQAIRDVEIDGEQAWRRRHLEGILQSYARAPYLPEIFAGIETVYRRDHVLLADFTTALIRLMLDALSLPDHIVRQSDLGIGGRATDLLLRICLHLGADRLLVLGAAEKHVDHEIMRNHGIQVVRADFRPPVYPQLWGDFIYNLSALDLVLNCGPKSRKIVTGMRRPSH